MILLAYQAHSLWKYPPGMDANNIASILLHDSTKPLPESMLTQIFGAILCH